MISREPDIRVNESSLELKIHTVLSGTILYFSFLNLNDGYLHALAISRASLRHLFPHADAACKNVPGVLPRHPQ